MTEIRPRPTPVSRSVFANFGVCFLFASGIGTCTNSYSDIVISCCSLELSKLKNFSSKFIDSILII